MKRTEGWKRLLRREDSEAGLQRGLEEEIRFHIEQRAARLMEQGMDETAARAEAERRFGDPLRHGAMAERQDRQARRQQRIRERLLDLGRDLRLAGRRIRRTPGFTVASVALMALGIAASTIVFSLLYGVVFRPLPYEHPGELLAVWQSNPTIGRPTASVSESNFLDLKARNRTFAELGAIGFQSFVLTGREVPLNVSGLRATANLLRLLSYAPAAGRGFTEEEDAPGSGERVMMLSQEFWRSAFEADPSVLGRTLILNGEAYTAVGILPAMESFPSGWDVWVPLRADPAYPRGDKRINLYGRIRPGITLAQVRADLDEVGHSLAETYPDTNEGWGFSFRTFYDWLIDGRARSGVWIAMGAVGLILLLTCVNLAGLLLVRVLQRRREIAIALAFGSGRGRAIRQVFSESFLLALAGGLFGVLLAFGGVALLRGLQPPGIPRVSGVTVNTPVLIFAVGVTLLAGLLTGLLAARQSSLAQPADALREEGRTMMGGRSGHRLRGLLVIGQLMLTTILLAGAALLVRSYVLLNDQDPGLDVRDRLYIGLSVPPERYPDYRLSKQLYRRLVEGLEARPEIVSAALIMGGVPLVDGLNAHMDLDFPGREDAGRSVPEAGEWRMVTPGWFRTMGVPLRTGRDFTETDDQSAPLVCIVSESLAEDLWPGREPLGQVLWLWARPQQPATVVGICGDIRERGLDQGIRRSVFLPLYLTPPMMETPLILHVAGDAGSAVTAARAVLREIDPGLPLGTVQRAEEVLQSSLGGRRFLLVVLIVFAGVALLLAVAGIAGVIGFTVNQRIPEFGIRVALGASGSRLLAPVIGQGLRLAVAGIVLGMAGTVLLSGLLASQLWGIAPTDPLSYLAGGLVLLVAAVAAVSVPALRTLRVDPVRALNAE
jgi:putative ABC transport system permease protein